MKKDAYNIYKNLQRQNIFFFKSIKQKDNSFNAGIKCAGCLDTLIREKFTRTNYNEDIQIKSRLMILLAKQNHSGKCPKCGSLVLKKENKE